MLYKVNIRFHSPLTPEECAAALQRCTLTEELFNSSKYIHWERVRFRGYVSPQAFELRKMSFARNSMNPMISGSLRRLDDNDTIVDLVFRVSPTVIAFFIAHSVMLIPGLGLFYLFYRVGGFPYSPLVLVLIWLGVHTLLLAVFHIQTRITAAEIKKLFSALS